MLSLLLPLALLIATPAPAPVLCFYDGELYAKTTVEQEFADSAWVGRVRVMSGQEHLPPDDSEEEPWILYRVQVVETFKGRAATELSVFTQINSGGFYLDRETGPDVGGEYLLFLNPGEPPLIPAEAQDAMVVNYSCGQSGLWREVSAAGRRTLARLKSR